MGGEGEKWVVVRPVDRRFEATTGMLERAVRPVVVVRLMAKVACTARHRPTSDGQRGVGGGGGEGGGTAQHNPRHSLNNLNSLQVVSF